MRKLLALAGSLCLASVAEAAITSYFPTRDTFMRGGPTDLHGTDPSGRASKAYLDFYVTDFDRTAIRGLIEGQLGHALTFEDMGDVEVSLTLFSNDAQGYQPTALSRPAAFRGAEDWVEGSNETLGATKGFAVYDPVDSNNNRTWKRSDGTEVAAFLNLERIENAVFEEWGGDPFTYRRWVLDDEVAFAYLTDPQSLGLFLNSSDAGNAGNELAQYNNTEVFSREAPDPSRLPFLEVDVVPEPSTFLVAALAGAGLIVRRRRLL